MYFEKTYRKKQISRKKKNTPAEKNKIAHEAYKSAMEKSNNNINHMDKGVVLFSSGHKDYYTDTYIQISKSKVNIVAERLWHVKILSETKSRTENKYTVMGASVKKSKYEAYVKSLEKENVVTHNQLEWRKK